MLDLLCMSFLFFFFKQKTAYEMRISDWSSDVCSADLRALQHRDQLRDAGELATDQYRDPSGAGRSDAGADGTGRGAGHAQQGPQGISADPRLAGQHKPDRSEEHTSELQSLMRISYAVFCLKKKIILQKYHEDQTQYNTTNKDTI